MHLYNFILENVFLPIGDLLLRSHYISSLKEKRKVLFLPENELKILEKENLKKVLKNAVENTEFYNSIALEGDNPFEWLKKFPIVDKKILNANGLKMLTCEVKGLKIFKSSGSSGIQSMVYMSRKEVFNLRAILTSWWELEGFVIGGFVLQTGMSPKRSVEKKLKDIFFRTKYFVAFELNENKVLSALNKIKNQSTVLIGYASSINFIAQVALKNNLKVKFKSVISLGDKLYAHYRKNLESAFQCKVYDTYGSSEGFMIGFQYDLDYLYQYTHQTYLEILDDNGNPVPDGVMGNVVVTRLDGFSMPLIRYKLGDLAIKLPKDKYPDKRKLAFPILQQIIGRNTDVLKTPNGNVLNVHFFTGIIEHYQEIEQFRVLQTKINELNIEIIKGEKFTEVVWEKLRKDLSSKLNDPSVKVIYTFVTEIPSSKSGKPEIVKSLIH